MDAAQFDQIVRRLIGDGTRRGVLRLLGSWPLGGAFAFVLSEDMSEARKKHKKKHKRTCSSTSPT